MYQLNKFCNIISGLRKKRGWTQVLLADKLGITPQSISKWECGIGYPDVTLFPVIADLFGVSIGVLFGETQTESGETSDAIHERNFVFEPLNKIEIRVGNPCDIEVTDGVRDHAALNIQGDATFMEYLLVEKENGTLRLSVKNPTGSDARWVPYERGAYRGPNRIRIQTGVAKSECTVTNYLDLTIEGSSRGEETTRWICKRPDG